MAKSTKAVGKADAGNAGLAFRELAPSLWPDFERLFGANGACGGCWCMTWRLEKGERWEDVKGTEAKQRMQELVMEGKAHGLLAYKGSEPIGWCSFGPRRDYAKLDRATSLKCDDADEVWSIPCFFIRKEYRGQGVAGQMLEAAVKAIRKRGGRIAEGYPIQATMDPMPAAFAWTGLPSMFEEAGFERAEPEGAAKGKQRMRKRL